MGLIAASSPFPTLASRGTHLSPSSSSSSSVFKTRAGNSPLAVRDPLRKAGIPSVARLVLMN